MPASVQDALLRHQVYLEGVKAGAYDETEVEERAAAVEAAILGLIAGLGVANLNEVTLRRLNQFIRQARRSVGIEFNRLSRALQSYTREFFSIDNQIQREILRQTQQREIQFTGKLRDIRRAIENKVVPGVGVPGKRMLPQMLKQLENELVRLIRSGYANALTTQELIAQLLGEGQERHKGWSGKLRRNTRNGFNTLLQHISANLGGFNQAQVFDRYQWVSVIDDVTTDICLGRDGKTYVYGRGPIPPAHYNCRSTIVPYTEGADGLAEWRGDGWFSWAREQPDTVLSDMIGAEEAEKLLRDSASPSNFKKLTTVKKLPLQKFRDKLSKMLQ